MTKQLVRKAIKLLQQVESDVTLMTEPQSVSETERKLILSTLAYHDGNKSRAARSLGISRETLYQKLKAYKKS